MVGVTTCIKRQVFYSDVYFTLNYRRFGVMDGCSRRESERTASEESAEGEEAAREGGETTAAEETGERHVQVARRMDAGCSHG